MLFLRAVSLLICVLQPVAVRADSRALPNELLFFYYLYRTEKSAGLASAPGYECGDDSVVAFSRFVDCVMEKKFTSVYRPFTADYTYTPDQANLEAINEALSTLNNQAQWKIQTIQNGARNNQVNFIRSLMTGLADYAKTGELSVSDASEMMTALRNALYGRYLSQENAFRAAIDGYMSVPEYDLYIEYKNGWYDWRASLNTIKNAVTQGTLTQRAGDALTQDLNYFSRNMGEFGGSEIVQYHSGIMQQYQNILTEVEGWINTPSALEASGKIPPWRIPDAVCSASDTKRSLTSYQNHQVATNSKHDKTTYRRITIIRV